MKARFRDVCIGMCCTIALVGCSSEVEPCSDSGVVDTATNLIREQFIGALSRSPLFVKGAQQLGVTVTLKDFREYQEYNPNLKQRYCEASSELTITEDPAHLSALMALGGAILKVGEPVTSTERYTIQRTEDGQSIISIQQ